MDLDWVPDTRASQELALDARLAYAAMSELSEPLRLTIVAVDVLGLSYKEAARALPDPYRHYHEPPLPRPQQLASALDAG